MVQVWSQPFLCQVCVTFLFPDWLFHFSYPVNLTINLLYSLLLPIYMPPNPKKEEQLPKTPVCFSLPFSKLNQSLYHFENVFVPILIVYSFSFLFYLLIHCAFIHYSAAVLYTPCQMPWLKRQMCLGTDHWHCSMDLLCHSKSVKVTLGLTFK